MLAALPADGALLARLSSHAQAGCRHALPVWGHRGHRRRQCLRASIDATNWDAEMSIFKQRIQKPNQLETLRNIEAIVDVGKARSRVHPPPHPTPTPPPPNPNPPHPMSCVAVNRLPPHRPQKDLRAGVVCRRRPRNRRGIGERRTNRNYNILHQRSHRVRRTASLGMHLPDGRSGLLGCACHLPQVRSCQARARGFGTICLTCFVIGARVLLWRRSDNICFALLLGSGDGVCVGEAVECQVQGILQV